MPSLLAHIRKYSASHPLPGLVWAIRGDADGAVSELSSGSDLTDTEEGWHWLHFSLTDSRACALLESLPGLPAPAAKLLRVTDEIQQVHTGGSITFGMIADLQRGITETTGQFGLLHFLLTDRLLITGRRCTLAAAGATRQLLQGGLKIKTVEALLETIIQQAVNDVELFVDQVARDVDRIEDAVIAGSVGDVRRRLGECRRTTVSLHRHISEMRMLFQRLDRTGKQSSIPPLLREAAAGLSRQCEQIDGEIVAVAERTRLLQEEIAAMLAEETNKHLRVLSILTILFLPPTFIAGLFGMNLRGMMFAESEIGFWAGVALAVASTAAVVWILKRAGILGRSHPD